MSLIFSTLNDKTPTDQRKCAIQLMNRFVIYFFISCLVNSETSLYQPAEKLKSWYDVYFRCFPVWCDQKLDYSSIKVPIMTWLKLNQSTAAQVASNTQSRIARCVEKCFQVMILGSTWRSSILLILAESYDLIKSQSKQPRLPPIQTLWHFT